MSASAKDYRLAAAWVRELRERGIASHEAAQTAEAGFAYLFSATNPAFQGATFADACKSTKPAPERRPVLKPCDVEGCPKLQEFGGLCAEHDAQATKLGDHLRVGPRRRK